MNNLYILGLIAFALVLVYFILPKLFKNYEIEKGIKLLLIYIMMGYLSYDFFLKEKFIYIPFFVIGAITYTYMVVIAKKKQ